MDTPLLCVIPFNRDPRILTMATKHEQSSTSENTMRSTPMIVSLNGSWAARCPPEKQSEFRIGIKRNCERLQ